MPNPVCDKKIVYLISIPLFLNVFLYFFLMRKFFFILFFFLLSVSLAAYANFEIWASAIYLDINGTAGFYNTQKSSTLSNIGSNGFSGHLGVFASNSGTFKLLGAEIRTLKDNYSNICSGNLFYTIYAIGNRPAHPVFSLLTLSVSCNCNGNSFYSCGGGSCNSIYEQKLQNVSQSIDLTDLDAGDYTLEIYYQLNGDNTNPGCNLTYIDNYGGFNYKANFTISSPLSVNLSAFDAVCYDNSIKLRWTMQTENSIEKYEIEKSLTGLTFTKIGEMTASNSPGPISYYFFDENPIIGTNYYRIKMYHSNTSVSISNIKRIYFGKVGNTLFIYPNPSGNELSVRFAAVDKGRYQMNVITNSGQQIFSTPISHDGSDKTIQVRLPITLSKGVYRLVLISNTQFFKQTFLIK